MSNRNCFFLPKKNYVILIYLTILVRFTAHSHNPYGYHPKSHYEVPKAKIEVFTPAGLKISIPHEPGMEIFAVHAKVNQVMHYLEAGYYSRDVLVPKNGRWTFYDDNACLQIGDIIYYWTYVQKNGLGYRMDDQRFIVTGIDFIRQ